MYKNLEVRFFLATFFLQKQGYSSDLLRLHYSLFGISSAKLISLIRRYVKRGYLLIGKEEIPLLTARGHDQLLIDIPSLHDSLGGVWNSTWYVIAYEISESKRDKRDALRRFLQSFNFIASHRSLWVTPYKPGDVFFRELNGEFLHENLKYFEASNVLAFSSIVSDRDRQYVIDLYKDAFLELHAVANNLEGDKQKLATHIIQILTHVMRHDVGIPGELFHNPPHRKSFYELGSKLLHLILSK